MPFGAVLKVNVSGKVKLRGKLFFKKLESSLRAFLLEPSQPPNKPLKRPKSRLLI